MKRFSLLLLAFLSAFTAFSQDITGLWNGVLKVPGAQLSLVFHITKSESGYTSTMDSPDQKAFGIPVTSTLFENGELRLEITNAGILYTGSLAGQTITGTFTQGGRPFPMNLSRDKVEKEVLHRAQEPVKPYPYYSEDVTFNNTADGIQLSGTLTLPKKEGNFPVVVLISGSGPQNRDEELLGHKPFLVLSDFLTRNGIGVLRYDDRGTASSTGNFETGTTADFAKDAEAAVSFLKTRKDVNKKKIGLLGHSEGGIIAPMVAARNKDIAFIVLLAGTGIPGGELLLLQQELIGRASGISEDDLARGKMTNKKMFDLISASENEAAAKAAYEKLMAAEIQQQASKNGEEVTVNPPSFDTDPWMYYFIKHDPSIDLKKVTCPVLALNGSKDLQVPPKENLAAIKAALDKGGNKKVTTKELSGLNHLFQESKTGAPQEYAEIEQTLSPIALEEVKSWIIAQTK